MAVDKSIYASKHFLFANEALELAQRFHDADKIQNSPLLQKLGAKENHYRTYGATALDWTFVPELVIWLSATGIYYLSLLMKCSAKKRIKHHLRNMAGTKISFLDYQQLQKKDCGNLIS